MESFDKLKAQKDTILTKQERALSKMRETLRTIAEQDASNCDCDHSTDECCALVGEPCPKCLAERALSNPASRYELHLPVTAILAALSALPDSSSYQQRWNAVEKALRNHLSIGINEPPRPVTPAET